MKKVLTILVFIACLQSYAQTIVVKDKITLQPLANVRILKSGIYDAVSNRKIVFDSTNAKGEFKFIIQFNPLETFKFLFEDYYTEIYTGEALEKMNFLIFLTENIVTLNQAVVSASRFEEKVEDVDKQIVVINKKEMAFINQSTTADLLQQSGKVFVQKSQMGGGSIVMRGFEANKVLMVVDGIRMNNAIYRGGHLQNSISVDNNMLDKTELLFGAGSVMYGSDALGGVVSFYTNNPSLSNVAKPFIKTNAFLRYGTAMSEKTGHIDFNFGLRKIAFLSSFTFSDFNDMTIGKRGTKNYENWGRRTFYIDRINNKDSMVLNKDSFKQIPTGYKQYDVMQKILFKQNKYLTHTFNFQYSTTSNIPRYDRLTELQSNGKPEQAEWYYGPQTRLLTYYKLAIEKATIGFNKANILLAYQDLKESRNNRGFGSNFKSKRVENIKVLSLNADCEKRIFEKSELRYGAEFTTNDVVSTATRENILNGNITPQTTRYPDGGSIMRTYALYASQTIYLSKNWLLNSGLRFTNTYLKSNFNDKSFFPFLKNQIEQTNQNTSGNIGLVYLLKNNLKMFASIATGFRAPNVDDIAKVFESNAGRVIIPNANLKPEQTTTIDFGINKSFNKKLNIELNGFYNNYSSALTIGRSQLNGNDTITFNGVLSNIYTTQNAQNAFIYGYYSGIDYAFNKKWNLNASLNYTYGRIKTDTTDYPLDHISPVFGRVSAMYKTKQLKVELFSIFNGAKKTTDYNLVGEDNPIYSADAIKGFNPAFFTLNIRGSYQLNKIIQFQLAVENILDQHYRTFSSGYSGAGRNLMATVRGSF
ncbi:MAG: TonB-dependent receptor [Bacteroidetes bacterium]|nr:TonB-dependent receptor [Bacteroidota bacterium]